MMKNHSILIIAFIMFFCNQGMYAQNFDFDKINNSLVRIYVDVNQKRICLTGFVWQSKNQVVSAMHGMVPTGKITAIYPGAPGSTRELKIKKVYPDADLVLLEWTGNQDPLPGNAVTPINSFNTEPIKVGSDLHAIGYHIDASGSITKKVSKGKAYPEKLSSFLSKKDLNNLISAKYPKADIDILYIDGSLLPGFSGGPVFDDSGKLVGISNGGIENGAINISWVIPAKFLSNLESSNLAQLPSDFKNSSLLFSSNITIEGNSDSDGNFTEINKNDIRPIKINDFEFYKTKTRTIQELKNSSENPDNILKLENLINNDLRVKIDLSQARFDIYEDIHNDVIIVTPEGIRPRVQNRGKDDEALGVRFEENNTSLAYIFRKGDQDELNDYYLEDLYQFLDIEVFSPFSAIFGVPGFIPDKEYTTLEEDLDKMRKKIYVSAVSAGTYINKAEFREYVIHAYVTLLIHKDKIMVTAALSQIPSDLILRTSLLGINCLNPEKNKVPCQRFYDLFSAFAASHLTTFAY